MDNESFFFNPIYESLIEVEYKLKKMKEEKGSPEKKERRVPSLRQVSSQVIDQAIKKKLGKVIPKPTIHVDSLEADFERHVKGNQVKNELE